MNLSQGQLNVLMTVLPRMKFSHLVWLSPWTLPLNSLLNIRQAGMNYKVAAENDDTEMIGVSQYVDQVIKKEAEKYIRKSESNFRNMIQGHDNADQIMNQLKDPKYRKGADNKGVKSEVVSDMKDLGLNNEEAEQASNYVSLLRIVDGKYDSDFVDTITRLARKLKGFMPKGLYEGRGSEGPNNDIIAILSTGNILNLQEDWEDISEERKQKKEGLFQQLDKIVAKGKIPGFGLFIEKMKEYAGNIIKNISQTSKSKQWKREKTKSEDKTNEMADPLGESVEEAQFVVGPEEADDKDDTEKQTTEKQLKRDSIVEKAVKSNLPTIVLNAIPENWSDEKAEKVLFALENAMENKLFLKNKPNVPEPAKSTRYWTQNPEEMKKHGIETVEEYRDLFSGNVWDRISEGMNSVIERSLENEPETMAASVTLSHQLLKRFASTAKTKNLVGMVYNVLPALCNRGNVMVFERGRPKFAHTFEWFINNNKIHIANINDVDEEHIDQAYQAAFEAVREEVMVNNMEEQMNQ